MIYYYRCFNKILKLKLENPKVENLDFWLERFCPNIELLLSLSNGCDVDFSIELYDSDVYDYILENNTIKLYGQRDNYESYLAKFITQVFQKLLLDDDIFIFPAACVANEKDCILIIGDFWQGKTSTALNISKTYNLNLVSDNYIAIKKGKVIGATKYLSIRKEDVETCFHTLLTINDRLFFDNSSLFINENLNIKGFILPFINSSDNNIHTISAEESKWYLYQKFIRLLSGETILFNGNLPSPTFISKSASLLILQVVNDLLQENNILYISAGMSIIVKESYKVLFDEGVDKSE